MILNDFKPFKMNEYVSSTLLGGLGNQLYSIAFVLKYAKEHNKIAIFEDIPNSNGAGTHGCKTAFHTLFDNKLKTIPSKEYKNIHFHLVHENNPLKIQNIPKYNGNILFYGYFGSYKYHDENIRIDMTKLVYSNQELINISKSYFSKIQNDFNEYNIEKYVFMHIRRTDFLIANYHTNLTYYIDAYKKLHKEYNDKNIIVFSDDIEWCKNNMKDLFLHIFFVELNDTYIEFILMTYFKFGIIDRSTFSWWAAYLGEKNKYIIAPLKRYGGESELQETYEFTYPKEWKLV